MKTSLFFIALACGVIGLTVGLIGIVFGSPEDDYDEDLYDNCIEMERLLGNEINQLDPEQDICHQKMIKLQNKS